MEKSNIIRSIFTALGWLVALIYAFLTSSCITSHTEQFHGDADSVNYFRHGSVEWRYK